MRTGIWTQVIVLIMLTAFPLVPQGLAKVVYVTPAGNDNDTGLSWDQAKQSVQQGLNAAVAGDQVWVAAGTYNENIYLKNKVALYGGFVGAEDNLSQRNFSVNRCVLKGQSSYSSVVRADWILDNTTCIDGFAIQNGAGSSGYGSTIVGGGIYCRSASPCIANNTITQNTAGIGGGIYSDNHSHPLIINNVIRGNTATFQGGGVFCSSSERLVNNTISKNTSSTGGGVYCDNLSVPLIAGNIVAFNSSGIFNGSTSAPVLRNNCVYNPDGDNYSGLSMGAGDINLDPKLEAIAYDKFHLLTDSPCIDAGSDNDTQPDWLDMDGRGRITGNHVDMGADEYDGTICSFAPSIIRVSLSGSDVNDGSSWASAKRTVQAGIDATTGGEVWVAEGVYNERIVLKSYVYLYGGFGGGETQRNQRDFDMHTTLLDGNQGGSVVNITDCGYRVNCIDGFTIQNGTSYDGGGIYCFASSPSIAHNTIRGNIATSEGGGIYCSYSSPSITFNMISGNSATYGGGGICCGGSATSIMYNIVSGNSSPYGGGICCGCSASASIANNAISGNNCGIFLGRNVSVINNVISENGRVGIEGEECYSPIINNTICGSTTGIYCGYASPFVANNIIASCNTGIYTSIFTLSLQNNCVYNPQGINYGRLSPGIGDISLDPLFVDRAHGNFHLAGGSPCINAGSNACVQATWLDMDAQPRIHGSKVDMGADEFYRSGDCDGDGRVTAADLVIVIRSMDKAAGETGYDGRADLDGDAAVSSTDLSLVLMNMQ